MNIGSCDVKPWLSVVIPSHRGEQWIDNSLRSISDEAAEGIEVLLVDSDATSAARDIAQCYSDRLHIRIFERRDLLSWHAKTNFAVKIAKSDHISWLGVDDLWLPGRAAAARGWIEADPEAPLHFAPSAIIDRDGRKLGVWRCPLPTDRILESTFVMERLLIQNFVAAPAPIFRRDAWLNCGGLDETLWYTADWDLWLKLTACAPTHYHDEVTIGFRIHADALTMTGSRDTADFRLQMETVLDRHISKIGSSPKGLKRVALASIEVNAALASTSAFKLGGLTRAAYRIALLGPGGIRRYWRDSRIVERLVPRLRARLAGRL